jgi:hypothetical protein
MTEQHSALSLASIHRVNSGDRFRLLVRES